MDVFWLWQIRLNHKTNSYFLLFLTHPAKKSKRLDNGTLRATTYEECFREQCRVHDPVLLDKMKENNFCYFRCSYCSFTFNDYDKNLYNVVDPLPRLNMRLIESDYCRGYPVSQTFSDNIVKAMTHSIFGEDSFYNCVAFLMTEVDGTTIYNTKKIWFH